jgi:hypothetical protein
VQVSVPAEPLQDAAHRALPDECPPEMPELPPPDAGPSVPQVAQAHSRALRDELQLPVSARLVQGHLGELRLQAVEAPPDVVRQEPLALPDRLGRCLGPQPPVLQHWAAPPVVQMPAYLELQAGTEQRARRWPHAALRQV